METWEFEDLQDRQITMGCLVISSTRARSIEWDVNSLLTLFHPNCYPLRGEIMSAQARAGHSRIYRPDRAYKCLLPKAFFKCQKLITHPERERERDRSGWKASATRRMSDLARGLPLGKQLIQNHGHNLCKLLYRQDGSAGQKALTKCCHVYAWDINSPSYLLLLLLQPALGGDSRLVRQAIAHCFHSALQNWVSACTPAEYPNKYCHPHSMFGMFNPRARECLYK